MKTITLRDNNYTGIVDDFNRIYIKSSTADYYLIEVNDPRLSLTITYVLSPEKYNGLTRTNYLTDCLFSYYGLSMYSCTDDVLLENAFNLIMNDIIHYELTYETSSLMRYLSLNPNFDFINSKDTGYFSIYSYETETYYDLIDSIRPDGTRMNLVHIVSYNDEYDIYDSINNMTNCDMYDYVLDNFDTVLDYLESFIDIIKVYEYKS